MSNTSALHPNSVTPLSDLTKTHAQTGPAQAATSNPRAHHHFPPRQDQMAAISTHALS